MPKRYILALIVIVVIFFGGIFLIISLLRGGDDNTEQTVRTEEVTTQEVREFAKDAQSLTFTTYGSVVGEESRRAIKITVTSRERRVDVLNGYNESVAKTQTFPNTSAAFESLVAALAGVGYEETQIPVVDDERATCSNGRRNVYQAAFSSGDPHRSWSVSCSRKTGTFAGDSSAVQRLMRDQIPDYTKFVSGVKL